MKKYKVIVNNKHSFEVSSGEGNFVLNNETVELDIAVVKEDQFHIIKDNRSYNAKVIHANIPEKKFTFRINGNDYELAVKDRYDELLHKLGMSKGAAAKVKEIKAPMPGKVLSVNIEPGSEVRKGDLVLVLEAMKMENALKSPGDGKVKKIQTKVGDAVEKGVVLVVFE